MLFFLARFNWFPDFFRIVSLIFWVLLWMIGGFLRHFFRGRSPFFFSLTSVLLTDFLSFFQRIGLRVSNYSPRRPRWSGLLLPSFFNAFRRRPRWPRAPPSTPATDRFQDTSDWLVFSIETERPLIAMFCWFLSFCVADLTPAEQQLLLEIRRRKTELLQEIQVLELFQSVLFFVVLCFLIWCEERSFVVSAYTRSR